MNFKTCTTFSAALVGLTLSTTQAATVSVGGFTVVEADEFNVGGSAGNTVFDGGAPATGTTTRTQGSFSDAATWKYRTESQWSSSGTFSGAYSSYGNGGGAANTALTLTTTVTGLASDTYDVFAVYISRNDGVTDGGVAAALSGNSLVDYADVSGASGGATAISLGVSSGEWEAFAVKVGTVTGTGFAVDAGVLSSTDSGSGIQRNTYVGVAYQAVPEPSSAALLGLGGLALILRRRK